MTTPAITPPRSARPAAPAGEPAAASSSASEHAASSGRGDAEYQARHRLMLADLGLAANRIAQLEDRGLRPRARVPTMTARGRADFLTAVGEHAGDSRLHHIEKFKLKPPPGVGTPQADAASVVLAPALWWSRGVEELGLVLPPRDVAHTIDVAKYVATRLPQVAIDKIRAVGAEIFFGSADELQAWCAQSGWAARGQFGSPSSSEFVYLQRGSEEKMVITGIVSRARLTHQVLQLHFAGIDTATLQLRGKIEELQAATLGRLVQRLGELPDVPEKICFFGARRQVSQSIRRLLQDDAMPGAKLSATSTCVVDSFAFDHMTLELPDDRRVLLIGFRMPNGDLAEGSVSALLGSGVGTLVMCGAGGALDTRARIGDYLQIDAAFRDGEHLGPSADAMLPAPDGAATRRNVINITVDSPLEETEAWLDDAVTHADCVDVETAHVFRAFEAHAESHPDSGARLLAGLFVSDVVGQHPLTEKISSGDAYAGLDRFIGDVLSGQGLGLPRADA